MSPQCEPVRKAGRTIQCRGLLSPASRHHMQDEIEQKLTALGLSLPLRPTPIASFLPFRVAGGIVYLAGQTCELDGRVVYSGSVGEDVTLEAAREAARLCALNLLSSLREACDG